MLKLNRARTGGADLAAQFAATSPVEDAGDYFLLTWRATVVLWTRLPLVAVIVRV